MGGALVKQEVIGSAEVKEVMRAMDWNERETLGALALLWSGSQNRGISRASALQIGVWCQVEGREERQRLVEALSSEVVGYIQRVRARGSADISLDTFEIVGNRKVIAKDRAFKALRKRAGTVTKTKFPHEKSACAEKKSACAENLVKNAAGKPHLYPVQDSEQRERYSPLPTVPTVPTVPSLPSLPSRDEPELPGLATSTRPDPLRPIDEVITRWSKGAGSAGEGGSPFLDPLRPVDQARC